MKYLIALIALLLPTYLIRFDILGVPTTVLELLIYVVFLFGFVELGYSHLLRCKRKIWFPISLLLLGATISVFVAPEKTVALGQLKAFFIDPILVLFLITCFLESKDIKWIVYGLTGSGLFVSIYSIVQKILGHVTFDNRVIGIFGYSPNYVALFLTPIIVLLTAYGLQLIAHGSRLTALRKWKPAIIIGMIILINLYGLFLTGSRAGFLATGAGIIFFLILHFWEKIRAKSYFKIGLLILIVIGILGTAYAFKPNFQASSGRVVSSNNIRWQIWQTSVEMIKNQPLLGVGLGNYQNAFATLTQNRPNFPEYISPLALSSHNVFLMFYLQLGILGILGFVWLLVYFYRTGFSKLNDPWSQVLMAAMTALILQGLVDTPYFKNDLALIFWLIFGCMLLLKGNRITGK